LEESAGAAEFVADSFINIRGTSRSFLNSLGLNKTSSVPAAVARFNDSRVTVEGGDNNDGDVRHAPI
jgi:hypothetical protein